MDSNALMMQILLEKQQEIETYKASVGELQAKLADALREIGELSDELTEMRKAKPRGK